MKIMYRNSKETPRNANKVWQFLIFKYFHDLGIEDLCIKLSIYKEELYSMVSELTSEIF